MDLDQAPSTSTSLSDPALRFSQCSLICVSLSQKSICFSLVYDFLSKDRSANVVLQFYVSRTLVLRQFASDQVFRLVNDLALHICLQQIAVVLRRTLNSKEFDFTSLKEVS